jgi:hypothetical protein
MDLIRSRVRSRKAFSNSSWPQRGQILQLEKLHPGPEERPFAALLIDRTTIPNVWSGYAVAPESELDYLGDGDLPLDELCTNRDPLAGFVQTWNPVNIPIPSATGCLASLDREDIEIVQHSARRFAPGETRASPQQQAYRDAYRSAAVQWTDLASKLAPVQPAGTTLFDKIVRQLSSLALLSPIGQWRPAVEHPMGPEDDQALIWSLPNLEIRFDTRVCKVRKISESTAEVTVELFLGDILLESHQLAAAGDTATIHLPPDDSNAGRLTLSIKQTGDTPFEIAL